MLIKNILVIFASIILFVSTGAKVYADANTAYGDIYPEGTGLLEKLVTPGLFEPHRLHFISENGLMWTLVFANIMTFVAYTVIPIVILFFLKKRRDAIYPRIFFLFAAFIVLCGLHHLVHVISFWYPLYYLQAVIDIAMAIVSVLTAIVLVPTMRDAIKLTSPKELEKININLSIEIDKRRAAEAKYQQEKEHLQEALDEAEKLNKIVVERELKMIELKKKIRRLEHSPKA